ncbi:MAG: hypothetical protein AB1634_03260 [Thermodesulfobacteriota bacterium]
MVAAKHVPCLHSPSYAEPGDGTVLHRYLDDQFIPQFLDDAAAGRLTGNAGQDWRHQDRFGKLNDLPHLRLPVHRTFYVACCEVSCQRPGFPAFDPARIQSAGMVVRRLGPDGPERWLLRQGQAMGWRGGVFADQEPSELRRLLVKGLVRPRVPEPPYSGEESYPLHPLFLDRPGFGGRSRKHTLLYGYLPLGGSFRSAASRPPALAEGEALDPGLLHLWPFGTDGVAPWQPETGLQMEAGRPTASLAGLLATLLQVLRIEEDTLANEALRTLLGRIRLYEAPPYRDPFTGRFVIPETAVTGSLLAYLDATVDPLQAWLADDQRSLPAAASFPLPGRGGTGSLGEWLYVTEDEAATMRELLAIRTGQLAAVQADDLPIPRFGQGKDEIFFVQPFLRYLDERGCERLAWGPASQPFRVASPLDPEAARPSVVPLPGLDDLKRGIAKGVVFLTPKSLAEKIRSLSLDMEVKKKDPGRLAACWSISFSIPAITICALLLLMIILHLLNIIFFWLPYVFLALPRLCLKAEVKTGGSPGGGGAG